jgi:hypothetical protein
MAARRLSVAIGNTKETIAITIRYSGLRNVLFKTTSKYNLTISATKKMHLLSQTKNVSSQIK